MPKTDNKTTIRNFITSPRILQIIVPLVAVATFALCVRYDYKVRTKAAQARAQLDNQIDAEFRAIDSIRVATADSVVLALNRNADWLYMTHYRDRMDSLRAQKQAILGRAIGAAQRHKIISFVPTNESVFRAHSDVPGMRTMRQQYHATDAIIQEYVARTPRAQMYEALVRRHFDSLATAQIYARQRKIDSLLRVRHNQRTRY